MGFPGFWIFGVGFQFFVLFIKCQSSLFKNQYIKGTVLIKSMPKQNTKYLRGTESERVVVQPRQSEGRI
jgi:hypothetical protein